MAKLILLTDDGKQLVMKDNVSNNLIPRDILLADDFVAMKLWTTEDVAGVLKESGYDDCEENISMVVNTGMLVRLSECTDRDWLIIEDAVNNTKGLKRVQFTKADELEEYILKKYSNDDYEFSSLYFDVDVRMKKSEILETYAKLQKIINGDSVVCYRNIQTNNRNEIIGGEEVDGFVSGPEYEEIYKGNCEEFLKSFNGMESTTGLCRVYENGGIKYLLEFIL